MFDIGFWELMLIAIMGLVVLGPERLPSAIGTLSRWLGSIRQTANSLKAELNHELRVKEMHDNLKKAEQQGLGKIMDPELRASVEQLKQAAQSVQRPFANPEPLSGTADDALPTQVAASAPQPDPRPAPQPDPQPDLQPNSQQPEQGKPSDAHTS